MQVRFGNVSVLEFERRTDVDFNDEDFIWLNERRSDKVDIGDDKFHIFDLPFCILAGSEIGAELVERLKKYQFQKHFFVETKESEVAPDSV